MSIVRIKNATFYAYHGVMSEEKNIGGKFEVDVDLYFDFSEAAVNDDLTKTIDYVTVYNEISQIFNRKKYNLVETIAHKIADSLLENHKNIQKISVKLRKKSVPIGGVIDCIEVEVIK